MIEARTAQRGVLQAVLVIVALASVAAVSLVVASEFTLGPDDRSMRFDSTVVYRDADVSVRRIGSVSDVRAGYVRGDSIYATDDHFVYSAAIGEGRFHSRGPIPKVRPTLAGRIKNIIARADPIRRFRDNFGLRNVVVLNSGTRLVFYDFIYRSTDGGRTWEPVFEFVGDTVGPFYNGVAVDEDDRVYFGEYTARSRPNTIRIWKGTRDGRRWEVAHTFESGEIFHAHSLRYDGHRDRIWVTTGDRDEEARLLYSDDGMESLVTLGAGSQAWRIVSLVPTEEHLFWGSDDDRVGSNIHRWDFDGHRLDTLQFIGGPSYFSTRLEDGTIAITTTYEPESRFSESHDPPARTDLWISRNGEEWKRVLSRAYRPGENRWGSTRARMVLPAGTDESELLYVTPLNTVEDHYTMVAYRIEWRER